MRRDLMKRPIWSIKIGSKYCENNCIWLNTGFCNLLKIRLNKGVSRGMYLCPIECSCPSEEERKKIMERKV